MIWKKDKKMKKTITDDMTPKEKEQVLEYKKKVLKRWAIVTGLVALAAFGYLFMTLLDHVLKDTADGGVEINYSKLDTKLAWLGSEIQELDATISDALHLTADTGVLINNVVPGSPAEVAGLQRGDVIVSMNGVDILDSFQIQDIISDLEPGDTAKLVIDNVDGGLQNVYVTLGVQPDDTIATDTNVQTVAATTDTAVDPVMSTPWGISVSPLTDDARDAFDIPDEIQGVVIVAVVQGSLADSRGLEVGDVILSINQVPTPNLQTLYNALEDDENVLLDVYSPSDAKNIFVTLPDEGDSPPQVVLMSFDEEVAKTNRIIVSSDSASLDGQIYYRFASAPYFILYDFSTSQATSIANPYAAQVRGMGMTVAQMLIDFKIDAVVVGGIGPQAFDTFYLAKVKVYGPATGSVRAAITNYQLERLPELKEANLGGYGNSSAATIPTGGSPWTEEDDTDDDDEEGGLDGQPGTIPPMGKPLELTAQGDAQASRPENCVCPNCGTEVSHPASTACADMVCPICGSQLMTASPGTDSITGTDMTSQLPATDIASQLVPVAGSTVAPTEPPSRVAAIPTAGTLWTISNQPETTPVQQTAGMPVSGMPVSGMPTGGQPDGVPPVQQTFYLIPIAGGPPTDTGSAPADVGGSSQTARSTTCICPMDGTTVTHPVGIPCSQLNCPICGSRLVNAAPGGDTAGGTIQTGGKPDDVPPVQQTFYLVPISGQPDGVPPLSQGTQQVALVPVAGGPPEDMGMGGSAGGTADTGTAVDGPAQGGGQASSGASQSGRSDLCVCPMCGVTVTHPISVPCSSLNCPVCGSRLVNETPGGTGGDTTVGTVVPTAATTVASTSNIIYVAGASRKLVIPSTGKSLKSDIAQLLDDARYFLMFGLGTYDVVANPYYRDKRATGDEIAQFIVSEGGAVVVCNNVSATALKALKDMRVKVYTGFVGTVQQALDIYNDGRLNDSSTAGVILEDDDEDHGSGGGGPPTSKSKSKEKEEDAEIF
ncbi:NifB/NifX family molybdenum-iron cluster-binding protein [Planctomycetota bacterium]